MAFSRFETGIAVRVGALMATMGLLGWLVMTTSWYVTMALTLVGLLTQTLLLVQYAVRSSREIARFLEAIAFDDNSVSFSALASDSAFAGLGAAMTRVLDQLRTSRVERQEQALYLQTLIAHVPVALVSLEESGAVQLLNLAARRMFETACTDVSQFARYGTAFATGLEVLKPGESAIVRMERASGTLQLKAAVTGITLSGSRRRLISLQNIEIELTAQELAAWQTVIRVMAHEVTNSLTPISSLAATSQTLVTEVLATMPEDDPRRATLADATQALETMARRSEGLLSFVQNHRRITRRLVAKVEIVPARRVFSRLQRLLAPELATRHIDLAISVEPETLEVAADIELLDQALINLMRNAMEALRDETDGRITLSAFQESGGRVVIAVSDNGPGIPLDQRTKVFVPFFTTKRQGCGVGLTLVRQIAAVHGAAVTISDAPGGGAVISIRF